ncbi:MAG: type II toxin-antitoxin system YoeB family toxin [Burkholderiales bacterium]
MKSSGPRKLPKISTGGSGQTNRSQKKIDELVADAREHPFTGIGKPEPLRWEWKGYWSQRIPESIV